MDTVNGCRIPYNETSPCKDDTLVKRVLVNEPVCMGCHPHEVHCQLQHARSRDIVKAFKKESPRPVARLRIEARKPVFFSLRCQHCEEPAFVLNCPNEALTYEETDGALVK
jgi:carbon-monoxide dehydrogenase iron sulfur subunit